MPQADLLTLCEEAAEPTLQRIRSEMRQASYQVRPLVEAIERDLFHPDLSAGWLQRQCRVRDREVIRRFRLQTGKPPRDYFTDCRLEVAARMLATSFLSAGQIADLVGYATLGSFSRASKSWSGLPPSEFRRWRREEGAGQGARLAGGRRNSA